MAPSLRKSTQSKTDASAKAAKDVGFMPRPRKPLTCKQRYTRNKGLVSMKITKALESITVANGNNSPLLRLPAEICNMIFCLVVHKKDHWTRGIDLCTNKHGQESRSGTSTHMYMRPSYLLITGFRLPQVCRQIYAETATLVYAENTFNFATAKGLKISLSRRLLAQRMAIRRLVLPTWQLEGKDGFRKEVARMCPNLVSLEASSRLDGRFEFTGSRISIRMAGDGSMSSGDSDVDRFMYDGSDSDGY